MPSPTTANEFMELVKKSGIFPAAELEKSLRTGPPLPDHPAKCASALVKRGLLTPFQARLLLAGKHRGFRLGQYVVRDQLGTGGMGAVFLAQHETLKRKVALKVLTGLGSSADKLVLGRFLREARATAALDHPNIVRMFDVSQQGDIHYLVIEHVEGDPLDKVLAVHGPLPPDVAADVIAQAAAGLQHAHEKGFVHRDIKPANLMVTKDGTVKILDMGLARSTDDSDKLTELMDKGAVLGTADYLAPEIAIGQAADGRSDQYSLGATFFTLLAGRPPFEGNATQKLILHQTAEVPNLVTVRPGTPPGLAAVVARMLAKNPADRFPSAAEAAAALAPWMSPYGASRASVGLSATGAGSLPEVQQALSGVVIRTNMSNTPRPWALPVRGQDPSVVQPSPPSGELHVGASRAPGSSILAVPPAGPPLPIPGEGGTAAPSEAGASKKNVKQIALIVAAAVAGAVVAAAALLLR